ncbi:MAG: hypothetical protein V3R28_00435, partial [Desulfatiglandales bacterium]
SESSVSDGTALATPHIQYFHIAVTDADGFPLRNIKLTIEFMWAAPDVYGVVQFYHGGSPVDSPFNALTDDDGSYILRMDFLSGGGWEYNGKLLVSSGSAFGSAEFEVDTGA